ncbi:MAG: hypothetical protein H6712_18985 [Myxococcales bacterium]|nr:hypothetical protein [Myxococcales bacterium]MCB9715960.1 hypothetical protein [Myxococcales bacterium]
MSTKPSLPHQRPIKVLALVLGAVALATLVYVETVAARGVDAELDETELIPLARGY